MKAESTELNLWASLEAAKQCPETASIRSLCDTVEEFIIELPLAEQLKVVSKAMEHLAEVYAARAELLIETYEQRYNPQEPVVNLESCIELFIQSLHLDLSDLLEPEEAIQYPAHRHPRSTSEEKGSVVGILDKAALLSNLDQRLCGNPGITEEEAFNTTIAVAHHEDVAEWSKTIAKQFQRGNFTSASLLKLHKVSKMPIVEIWLGLLLGGFTLIQQGEFYDTQSIVVVLPKEP